MLPWTFPEGLKVACVVGGFPSGAVKPQVKRPSRPPRPSPTAQLDRLVINIELVRTRLHELEGEIAAVRRVVPHPRILKIVIESAALTDIEIVAACCTAAMACERGLRQDVHGIPPAGGTDPRSPSCAHGRRRPWGSSGGIRDAPRRGPGMIEAGASA